MIKEIVHIKQETRRTRVKAANSVKQKLDIDFYYHCNVGENHGLQSVEQIEQVLEGYATSFDEKGNDILEVAKQETLNLRDAYCYLMSEGEAEDMGYRGLLEESMLRKVNTIILRKLPRNERYTKPGVYCNNRRITQFRGEIYQYQQPEDMQGSVCVLLDRFNSIFTQSKCKTSEIQRLLDIFKSVAWLVFELLDLHPFSDGNGRLCRLLCSYVLSNFTPFPSPICNINSSKFDFENALIACRNSKTRYPYELTNLIIQSNLASWRTFAELCKYSSMYEIDKLTRNL